MVLFYCSSNCVHTVGGFGVYIKHFNREIKGRAINHSVAMVLLLDYQTICLIVCVLGVDLVGIVTSNQIRVKWNMLFTVLLLWCYSSIRVFI